MKLVGNGAAIVIAEVDELKSIWLVVDGVEATLD
jgi:hypothetical protein